MAISLNHPNQFYLNKTLNLRPHNSTNYAVLYPQNGDRIVNIDYVTSLRPIYWVQLWLHGSRRDEIPRNGPHCLYWRRSYFSQIGSGRGLVF